MRDLNQVILMGRLGADPVLRQTKVGSSVVNFSLATSRRFLKKPVEGSQEVNVDGRERSSQDSRAPLGYVEETEWHKIVVWGKQGEHCFRYLKKGDPVYLTGMIRSHSYTDQTGLVRASYEVHADDVHFLSVGRKVSENSEQNQESRIVISPEEEDCERTELSVS
jgi:single-strand DNA-binding protein